MAGIPTKLDLFWKEGSERMRRIDQVEMVSRTFVQSHNPGARFFIERLIGSGCIQALVLIVLVPVAYNEAILDLRIALDIRPLVTNWSRLAFRVIHRCLIARGTQDASEVGTMAPRRVMMWMTVGVRVTFADISPANRVVYIRLFLREPLVIDKFFLAVVETNLVILEPFFQP